MPELAELGLDPVDEPMSWTDVRPTSLPRAGRPSSSVPHRPHSVAGIGPVYADEILSAAGLRHDRDVRLAVDPGDAPPLPGAGRDPPRGGQAPRHDPRRRTASPTSPASPATTRRAQGLRARRPGLQPLPRHRQPRPSSRASPTYYCPELPGLSHEVERVVVPMSCPDRSRSLMSVVPCGIRTRRASAGSGRRHRRRWRSASLRVRRPVSTWRARSTAGQSRPPRPTAVAAPLRRSRSGRSGSVGGLRRLRL